MVLKITSVLLAVVLWIYVMNQTSVADNSLYNTYVNYNNLGEGLILEEAPGQVEVRVWGGNANPLEVVAYVDLEGVGAGVHTLPVQLLPIRNALLTRVNPDSVMIRIAQQDSLAMPIIYEITNPPPEGYSLISAMILPSECLVRVDGSVENVSVVVAPLNLTGVRQIAEKIVDLELRDRRGQVIHDAVIEPRQAKVYVVIQENIVSRLMGVQIQYTGSPGSGYEVTEVVIEPAQVTLLGNQNVIGEISAIFTQAINIEGVEVNHVSLINLDVPNEVMAYPSQVLATIKVSAIEPEPVENEDENETENEYEYEYEGENQGD